MIPDLVIVEGAPWSVLPPGIHEASLEEVWRIFGFNDRRKLLLEGFQRGAENLFKAGCTAIYLDGSFVTSKPHPGDFDACWDPENVNPELLDPILLVYKPPRSEQKEKYQGEFIPNLKTSDGQFLDFFQNIRDIEGKKGIIKISEYQSVSESVKK